MTNREWLNSMSNEELAKKFWCPGCKDRTECKANKEIEEGCIGRIVIFLEAEHTEVSKMTKNEIKTTYTVEKRTEQATGGGAFVRTETIGRQTEKVACFENAEELFKSLKDLYDAMCGTHPITDCEYCWNADICSKARQLIAEIERSKE